MGFFSLRSRNDPARKSFTTTTTNTTSSTQLTTPSSRSSTTRRSIDSGVFCSEQARNAIYSAIALCGLAGYSSATTRKYLRSLPEFDHVLAHEPSILKIEGKFYTLQKTRHPSYMAFINGSSTLEKITPTSHRIDADEALQEAEIAAYKRKLAAHSKEEDESFSDPLSPEEELNRWKDSWTDECSILDLEGRADLAARFRADIEHTYADALAEAQRERRRAQNLQIFTQGSLARRAAFAENSKSRSPDRATYKNAEQLLAKAKADAKAKAAQQAQSPVSTLASTMSTTSSSQRNASSPQIDSARN